jgi:predicted DNA binding protein
MTSIAEFTLAPGEFPLGAVFEVQPDVTLSLDRVVPSGDTVMPYFWVEDVPDGLGTVLQCFEGLPELRSITLIEDLGDRGLFRAEWKPEYMGIMAAIEDAGVTVVSATGSHDGWLFELRATAHEQLSEFQEYCDTHGIDVSLVRLRQLSETDSTDGYGLTPEQHEALRLAFDEGYFEDPRTVDQETLASELGISRQALSARLRRGYRTLIGRTIARHHEGDA